MNDEYPNDSKERISQPDYRPYRFTSAYLGEASRSIPDRRKGLTPELRELMKQVGYTTKNVEKFRKMRSKWDCILTSHIPLVYLEAIGVEREKLDDCVASDKAEYATAIEGPFYPRQFNVRYMPALYGARNFATGTPEDQAIRKVLEFMDGRDVPCKIVYHGLKTIHFGYRKEEGNYVHTVTYEPDYFESGDYLTFTVCPYYAQAVASPWG